jgi:hypothetical protein
MAETLHSIAKTQHYAIDLKFFSDVHKTATKKDKEESEIILADSISAIQNINQDFLKEIYASTDKYINFFKDINNVYQDNFPIQFHNIENMPEFKYGQTNINELNQILEQYELSNEDTILRAQKSIVLRGPKHMDGKSNIYTLPRSNKIEEGIALKLFGAIGAGSAGITAYTINNNMDEFLIRMGTTITIAGLGASALLIEKDTFNKAAKLLEERKRYVHEAVNSIDNYLASK